MMERLERPDEQRLKKAARCGGRLRVLPGGAEDAAWKALVILGLATEEREDDSVTFVLTVAGRRIGGRIGD